MHCTASGSVFLEKIPLFLMRLLDEQEMATLRKSLESSTMERDAAIVSRVCWLSLSVDVRIDIVSGCKEIPLKIVSNFISKNVWVVVIVPKPVFQAPHLAVLKSSLLKSSLVTLHGI